MNYYFFRKIIRRLPGKVVKLVPIPNPEIIEGYGKRSCVGKLIADKGYKSALIVTDKTLYNLGFLNAIIESLNENNIKYTIFNDICGEPTVDIIDEGRKITKDADCLIALGGGSVLDSSKVIAAGAKQKKKTKRYLHKFSFVKPIPMIPIPSTAGTGAEISVGAIVKNKKHVKKATVMVGLRIPYVILDSELTINAPEHVTMCCGIDALSHGLEGCLSATKVSDVDMIKSKECVKLVLDNLIELKDDPKNIDRRQALCLAANYGGNAINKQLAGYIHAVAHTIGAKYNISHGEAIAYSMYPVMKYNKDYCKDKIAELAKYCEIASADDDIDTSGDKFMNRLKEFLIACGFSNGVSAIKEEDYKMLIKNINADSINYSPAKTFKDKDIIKILEEIKGGIK